MIDGHKLIGVCLTKLEDEYCRCLLEAMREDAKANDASLFVFNSFLDFFYHNEYEQGAQAIYQLIQYELLDALVILDQYFFDKDLVRQMIDRAQAHHLPVIVLYGAYPGCYSITKDYDGSFAQLIEHVLDTHAPRDIRYIAGTPGMPHTERRLAVFRRVMAEHGREVTDDLIAYCDDWSGPVGRAIDAWAEAGTLPDAIICASDAMARAACEQVEVHGLRVPDDVIITGFDGLPSLKLHTPQFTTCALDIPATAHIIFRMIEQAASGASPYVAQETYTFVLSESCGCCKHGTFDGCRTRAQALFHQLEDCYLHEQNMFSSADRILRNEEPPHIVDAIRSQLLPSSILALNQDLLSTAAQNRPTDPARPYTSHFFIISPDETGMPYRLSMNDLVRQLRASTMSAAVFSLQSLYVGNRVCGFFLVQMEDMTAQAYKIRRLCRIMNMEFGVLLSRLRQEHIAMRMSNLQSLDSVTGLMNLRGLTTHITDQYQKLSAKSIAVSVYVIYRYQQILEDNGLEYAEQLAQDTAAALREANTGTVLLARTAPSDFLVINLEDTLTQVCQRITDSVARFYGAVEATNAERSGPPLEVHCGCVVSRPGWENNLPSFIKAANGEMYLNRMQNAAASPVAGITAADDSMFTFELLEKNLFTYHFQPIVDAHSGAICGYEALMRTMEPVHMSPIQVLAIAEQKHRLYDIERATLFNVMGYVDSHPEQFDGKRVYINSIPGYFLNDQDLHLLTEKFSHLFSRCTIEITETNDTDDAELMQLRRLEHDGEACQLAIDDYGTGFSNIVNLLRYQPQVIKIDQFLVSGVDSDSNKQLFIRSTIEFARMNGILVLAEGVETREELSKVIELGVDMVQGYYLARPEAEVLQELPEDTRSFIIEETLRFSRSGVQSKVYHAQSGDRLDLLQLAVQKYTAVELAGGAVTIVGQPKHYISIPVTTTPGSYTQLYLENVYIRAGVPAITLGADSSMVLTVRGNNAFDQQGILVPPSAALSLAGDGELFISCMQKKGAVIGADVESAYGHIRIDMTGRLTLHAENESSVCVGGGHPGTEMPIELLGGELFFEAKGIHTVAVGCLYGNASVVIGPRAHLNLTVVGNEAVGIGATTGNVTVVSDGTIDARADGEHILCIGVKNSGTGSICLRGPENRFIMHGANAICAGTFGGDVEVRVESGLVNLFMEGACTCALGSFRDGTTTIAGGCVTGQILSNNPMALGAASVITGGSVTIRCDNPRGRVTAVNAFGDALVPVSLPGQDIFSREIVTPKGTYTYTATRHSSVAAMCVYLPAQDAAALSDAAC